MKVFPQEMTFSAHLQIFVQFCYAVYKILMRVEEDKKIKIVKGFDKYFWGNKSMLLEFPTNLSLVSSHFLGIHTHLFKANEYTEKI